MALRSSPTLMICSTRRRNEPGSRSRECPQVNAALISRLSCAKTVGGPAQSGRATAHSPTRGTTAEEFAFNDDHNAFERSGFA